MNSGDKYNELEKIQDDNNRKSDNVLDKQLKTFFLGVLIPLFLSFVQNPEKYYYSNFAAAMIMFAYLGKQFIDTACSHPYKMLFEEFKIQVEQILGKDVSHLSQRELRITIRQMVDLSKKLEESEKLRGELETLEQKL